MLDIILQCRLGAFVMGHPQGIFPDLKDKSTCYYIGHGDHRRKYNAIVSTKIPCCGHYRGRRIQTEHEWDAYKALPLEERLQPRLGRLRPDAVYCDNQTHDSVQSNSCERAARKFIVFKREAPKTSRLSK